MAKASPTEFYGAARDHAADTTARFQQDQELRALGWRVYSREVGQETLWNKGDEILPESVVLRRIDRQVVRVKDGKA